MTSPLDDGAARVITEIDYDSIRHTHLLSDKYKFTGIVELDPKKWGRWTSVKNLGHHYKSEKVHLPREKRIGILCQGVGFMNTDAFLPFDSIPRILEAEIPERGSRGNSPHCPYCTSPPDSYHMYEWPLDPTYSTHRSCFEKFQTFVEDIYEKYHTITVAHVV